MPKISSGGHIKVMKGSHENTKNIKWRPYDKDEKHEVEATLRSWKAHIKIPKISTEGHMTQAKETKHRSHLGRKTSNKGGKGHIGAIETLKATKGPRYIK